jgi:septum site-determining protein MinD
LRASNVGSPVTLNNPASSPARAYVDATKRLLGETIAMTIPAERSGLMNLLRGRRAA